MQASASGSRRTGMYISVDTSRWVGAFSSSTEVATPRTRPEHLRLHMTPASGQATVTRRDRDKEMSQLQSRQRRQPGHAYLGSAFPAQRHRHVLRRISGISDITDTSSTAAPHRRTLSVRHYFSGISSASDITRYWDARWFVPGLDVR